MIISLQEVVSNTSIKEDTNGRKVFTDTFTTQEILVNTENIVSVRPVDDQFLDKLDESSLGNFRGKQFSSVFLNKGGINSADIVVIGSPNEIMNKVNKRILLND